MSAAVHRVSLPGALLARGFWLYVWTVATCDGQTVLYVGRTGDTSSPHAQSPFIRLCSEVPRFMREFVAACMSVSGIGRALSWTTSRFERTRDRSGTGTMACNVGANLRLLSLRSDWVC